MSVRLRWMRFLLADLPTRWLPPFGSAYLRSHVYRRIGGLDVATDAFVMSAIRFPGPGVPRVADVHIGARCLISTNVVLRTTAPIVIEDDVTLSPFCEINTEPGRQVRIGRGSWLALRVIVGPGVTIGPGCVVASGSVIEAGTVIPPNSFAEGAPATVVGALEPDSGHRVTH
jgi:acetyltransferase-like isoleucine patch superfamily enzyme